MWSAWQSLKTYQQKPSNDLEVTDSIAAYCVDKAVMWFGVTVENLLSEREETMDGKRGEAKYELEDLLDPAFRVPKPTPKPKKQHYRSGVNAMLAMAAQSNGMIKRWRGIAPA